MRLEVLVAVIWWWQLQQVNRNASHHNGSFVWFPPDLNHPWGMHRVVIDEDSHKDSLYLQKFGES